MSEQVAPIRLVAGLGNPGAEYAKTRHNIGFLVLDAFAADIGAKWEKAGKAEAVLARTADFFLVKPASFINHSGMPLFQIAHFFKIEPAEVLLVLDDFALPLGRLRIRPDGGTGGHNGLESVIVQFGTDKIPRLRIGIGGAPRAGAVDHVLGRFFEEEMPMVQSMVERSVKAVKWTIDKGLISAMNTFNQPEQL